MRRRAGRSLGAAGVVVVGLLAAACGDEAVPVALPNVFDLAHDPTAAIADRSADTDEVMPAEQLRSELEKALTWHGITVTKVMVSAYAGDPAVDAWVAQLTENTDEITRAVGLVYGRDAAFAFNQQWAQHTQFLVDYAVAIARGDDAAADDARRSLGHYAADAGSFFATATANALPEDAVRELLDTHVGHMIDAIDAIDAGDGATALDRALEGNAYLATIAQGLATAFANQDGVSFPGPVDTQQAAYCSIVTTETGAWLLRELLAPGGGDHAALFESATGTPLVDAIGVIDQLQSTDPVLVASSADLALDRAFEHARPETSP